MPGSSALFVQNEDTVGDLLIWVKLHLDTPLGLRPNAWKERRWPEKEKAPDVGALGVPASF